MNEETRFREIGEISTKVDGLITSFERLEGEIRRSRESDERWRDLHDGQGEGTTHKQMWRSISKTNERINQVEIRSSVWGTIGGAISAALSLLGINIFGGPK